MSFIENIQKIQKLNKSFHDSNPIGFNDRIDKIYQIQKLFKEQINLEDESFLNSFLDQTVMAIKSNSLNESLIRPTGLIFAFVPQTHQFEIFYQLLILSIASQSPILFKFSDTVDKKIPQFIETTKLSKGLENHFDYTTKLDDSHINQLLQHPGVKGIYYVGQLSKINKYSALNNLNLKKIIRTSYKNFAVLLGDADLSLAAREVARGVTFGSAMSPFSIHKIYCLESHWQFFFDLLKFEIQKIEDGFAQSACSPIEIDNKFLNQVEADQGKAIWQSENLLLIKDLSNCSILQQEDYYQPAVIVSEHKYQYQIPKYANVSDLGQVAFVFGSEEKCKSFVKSLKAEYLIFNRYVPLYDKLISQRKINSICCNGPFEEFFSSKSIIY
jgi:acyl-CoA reductase-like NAD-dependent aldehyde dehydrogenase